MNDVAGTVSLVVAAGTTGTEQPIFETLKEKPI